MPSNLVIVESPAKAKTIEKYLGPDFRVLASYGHVQELVPKDGAVDTEDGYALKYRVIPGREKQLRAIAAALEGCDTLYLATDPDREGEAISWLLCDLLRRRKKLGDRAVRRIVFHEITREAVARALREPRDLSGELVDAFHSRKAIDYLVGFNLSPLLWRKIAPKLSAGRVQSPALRLIVEREAEIEAFEPREYWSVTARLAHGGRDFDARLHALDGKKLGKFGLADAAAAHAARDRVLAAGGELRVSGVEKRERQRRPAAPFTTSTLQQEASRKLRFSARKTMQVAQQLYEGVDLGAGAEGLITYMRTDSVTLAASAVEELRAAVAARWGAGALPAEPPRYKTKTRNAQEAHEAIRPTDAARAPDATAAHLDADQQRLYELVWKRAMASQMIPAVLDQVTATVAAGAGAELRATGSHVREPGFMQAYLEDTEAAKDDERYLPELKEGDAPVLQAAAEQTEAAAGEEPGPVAARQHFTEPPPRYTEASLVKNLEERGIGRPSTYAAILSTLVSRDYAKLEKRAFFPTAIGRAVSGFLTEHFPTYVDYEFTSRLEDSLDQGGARRGRARAGGGRLLAAVRGAGEGQERDRVAAAGADGARARRRPEDRQAGAGAGRALRAFRAARRRRGRGEAALRQPARGPGLRAHHAGGGARPAAAAAAPGRDRGRRADRGQRRPLRAVRALRREEVRLAGRGRGPAGGDAGAGAGVDRGAPRARGEPGDPGLRGRGRAGAERPLGAVRYRRREERQGAEGAGSRRS